ncbi:S-adenosyl-L-methionine-dependent methyltransferase [Lactifluus subvellereus]|nr:S-adenosyl-L-methionine-dependent methyltransferase [Lactifluus subvellereus]
MLPPGMKRSRRGDDTPVVKPSHQAATSEYPTLAPTYGPPTSRPRLRFKNRAGQPLVELPSAFPLTFHGLSPIKSFLGSSSHLFNPQPGADSEGVEDVDRYEIRDEYLNYRIIHGVKYDAYPRNEVPYYMLYDHVSTENEVHSHRLLQKLTRDGSPSFLYFPTSSPVRNALELGCGDGHWVVYAAQAWNAHGTTITGIDVPLSTQEVQTRHPGQIAENAELLSHNFITEALPFPDNSFDYVRLNDAMAAIPRDRWDFVLSEIHRVLSQGGRLELIHDQLCFSFVGPDAPVDCTFTSTTHDPHRSSYARGTRKIATPPHSRRSPYEGWEAEVLNCRDLERLYLEMLARRYGVHPQPRAVLVDAIQRRFGNGGLVKISNAHVCLPSQDFVARSCAGALKKKSAEPKKRDFGIGITIDWGQDKPSKADAKPPAAAAPPPPGDGFSLTNLPPFLSKKAAKVMGVVQLSPAGAPYQPPGVVVVRTCSDRVRRSVTFMPMSPTELEMHSNKHMHSVISAKLALEAHIEELQEKGKPSMSREGLDDALWQYSL